MSECTRAGMARPTDALQLAPDNTLIKVLTSVSACQQFGAFALRAPGEKTHFHSTLLCNYSGNDSGQEIFGL